MVIKQFRDLQGINLCVCLSLSTLSLSFALFFTSFMVWVCLCIVWKRRVDMDMAVKSNPQSAFSSRSLHSLSTPHMFTLATSREWKRGVARGVLKSFFIFDEVICADNMKNILRTGFARTYSLLMDSQLASHIFWQSLHIFLYPCKE